MPEIGLHALARHRSYDPAIAAVIDVDGIFLTRQILLHQDGPILGQRGEILAPGNLLGASRPGGEARLDETRERGHARRGVLGKRLVFGHRDDALHAGEQLMLVAADAQAIEGRDRQGDAERLELGARQGQRHELRIDRGEQEVDLSRPACHEQSRHELGCVAARHQQTTLLGHE